MYVQDISNPITSLLIQLIVGSLHFIFGKTKWSALKQWCPPKLFEEWGRSGLIVRRNVPQPTNIVGVLIIFAGN